jgi:hypothetical protein
LSVKVSQPEVIRFIRHAACWRRFFRCSLAACVGPRVLESAVDAALAAKAKGPLEKMLVHQLAALHRVTMKQLATTLNHHLTVPDMAKASNAAARSMQVFQEGLLTLERLHSGGKQTVVVKH